RRPSRSARRLTRSAWASSIVLEMVLTGTPIDIESETQAGEEARGIFRDNEGGYAAGEWRRNDETGELQFHAADGSVVSESEWAADSGAAPAADEKATEG
ncbi:MAG: hypothetical protein ACKOQ1_08205, partial [Actinomycetota bacterium]